MPVLKYDGLDKWNYVILWHINWNWLNNKINSRNQTLDLKIETMLSNLHGTKCDRFDHEDEIFFVETKTIS